MSISPISFWENPCHSLLDRWVTPSKWDGLLIGGAGTCALGPQLPVFFINWMTPTSLLVGTRGWTTLFGLIAVALRAGLAGPSRPAASPGDRAARVAVLTAFILVVGIGAVFLPIAL